MGTDVMRDERVELFMIAGATLAAKFLGKGDAETIRQRDAAPGSLVR